MTRRRLGVLGEEKFLRRGIFYGNIQDLSLVEGQDVAVIGGGNSALQMVENLHTVAREIYLIFATELIADAMVVEKTACLNNLQTYIEYKVVQFHGEETLTGLTIRKMAGLETRNSW
jgi:alkyl hydroperoxide reductase subunit AhpF